MKTDRQNIASSGVEALIDKLKNEGIVAGQSKAEQIVADAQKRAEWIILEAENEANLLLSKAKVESELIRTAGEDALKLAARDALLKLRDNLLNSFTRELIRVVGKEMAKEEFLQKLVIELAGKIRKEVDLDSQQNLTLLIPEDVDGVDDLRRNPDKLQKGPLSRLAAAIATDLLKEGIHMQVSEGSGNGLQIRLEDDNIVIDFSDKTVAALLLEHLQPRFRALLQGVVK